MLGPGNHQESGQFEWPQASLAASKIYPKNLNEMQFGKHINLNDEIVYVDPLESIHWIHF